MDLDDRHDTRIHQKVEEIMKTANQRYAEKARITQLLDESARAQRLSAEDVERRYLAYLGKEAPRREMAHGKREAFAALMARLKDAIPTMPRPSPSHLGCLQPAPSGDDALALPTCLSSATSCSVPQVPQSGTEWASCQANEARLRLRHGSNGLGGSLGLEAIPTVASMTGSLYYAFVPPSDGLLGVTAEVALTGTIACRSDQYWAWGDELPTIYGDATLTLRVLVHQHRGSSQQQMVVETLHSAPYPGKVSWFSDDVYVVGFITGIAAEAPVVVEVQAELYAFGRSDDGHAEVDFYSRDDFGIKVPALCLGLTPFAPIS